MIAAKTYGKLQNTVCCERTRMRVGHQSPEYKPSYPFRRRWYVEIADLICSTIPQPKPHNAA